MKKLNLLFITCFLLSLTLTAKAEEKIQLGSTNNHAH